ncbi:GldL-related protein [Flavobacterium sp.]|uniref:GldL-related protein n=1 Tax=Flavobacterium sp. TaxID=239 RepID=UPI00286BB377|nr:hypothetical protein [Flavobacterium sp.]
MRNIPLLVLFLLGTVITVLGALFKIMHQSVILSNSFLITGMIIEALAVFFIFSKLSKK